MGNRFKEMHKDDSKTPVESAYEREEILKPESQPEEMKKTTNLKRELIVEPTELRGMSCTRVDIRNELYAAFKYYSKINGYTQYQLSNALLTCDQKWTEEHPEFPSQDFVKECILNSKKKWHSLEGRIAVSLYCTEDNMNHLRAMCAKTCMPAYQYIEFLIKEYIGE